VDLFTKMKIYYIHVKSIFSYGLSMNRNQYYTALVLLQTIRLDRSGFLGYGMLRLCIIKWQNWGKM